MARYLLLVITNPTEGNDEEYNRWYTEEHLRDVLNVDGFVSAERFETRRVINGEPLSGKYIATYEIDSDDPDLTYEKLLAASDAGLMPMSETLDPNVSVTLIKPIAQLSK